MTTTVGVLRERAPGERRVALVPDVVARLTKAGASVLVEPGAGALAWFGDERYGWAGATLAPVDEICRDADVIVCVGPPGADIPLRAGRVVVGLLGRADRLVERGVTALSLDRLPRTLSRAQSMDALTSQASVAGYKAVVLAADTYGGFFPMLTTAAGTTRPAAVLVLGTGVAGLQAIGTARRLGALVTGYDVRPEARDEVASMGARFLELPVTAAGEGGYARELTDEERQAQQQALDEQVAGYDVVITTARVPGRRPPVLVTADALKGMTPGTVGVDLAAGPLGGNVEGAVPDATVVTGEGVTIVGAGDLAARMAPAASTAYARNIAALLTHLTRDGAVVIDPTDEITGALLVGGTR